MNDRTKTYLRLYNPFITNGKVSIQPVGIYFLKSENARAFAKQEIKERSLSDDYYSGSLSDMIKIPEFLQGQPVEKIVSYMRILMLGEEIGFSKGSITSIDFEDIIADNLETVIGNYEKAGYVSEQVADNIYKLADPIHGNCVYVGIDELNVLDLDLEKEEEKDEYI